MMMMMTPTPTHPHSHCAPQVSDRDRNSCTPFHLAAMRGRGDTSRQMLKKSNGQEQYDALTAGMSLSMIIRGGYTGQGAGRRERPWELEEACVAFHVGYVADLMACLRPAHTADHARSQQHGPQRVPPEPDEQVGGLLTAVFGDSIPQLYMYSVHGPADPAL